MKTKEPQSKQKQSKQKSSALLLISGGIDSPVAAKILQKQDINITAIHFSQTPFTDDAPEKKSIEACKKLKIKKIIVCQAGKTFQTLATSCYHDYYFILMKRMMLRVSSKIAEENKINFLITGEALAQVSSQTLPNLYAIDNTSKIQVLRPLLCYDKNEIIKIAKEIKTYDICTGPEVCDALGPKHPRTKVKLEQVEEQEARINVEKLTQDIINSQKVINL